MYASRLFQLLLVVVSILCVAQATRWDAGRAGGHGIARRQDTGDDEPTGATFGGDNPESTSSTEEESASQTEEPPTTSASPPPEETTTSAEETTEASDPTTSESDSASDPSETSSKQPEKTTSAAQTTSAPPEETSTSKDDDEPTDTKTKTTRSVSVATSVEVVTKTNKDGSHSTMTTTSRTTHTPGLNEENSDDDSGMSDKTRNTIIGVVVGVGGAILIGALAIVAWRIWGRKKHAEENDTLMNEYSAPGSPEKSVGVPESSIGSSGPQRTPFQTTLDTYHQPTGPVNASSNF